MSLRSHVETGSIRLSRRAVAVVASSAMVALGESVFAGDPVVENQRGIQARTAVQKMVRSISNREIRLTPVSRDFHRTIVRAIASDPRSEIIAVAGDDHAIRIFSAGTLDLLTTLRGHSDLIRTLRFSGDGARMVSGGNDGRLIIWDRDNEFRVMQRMVGTPALACVTFSPDGSEIAAVGFDHNVFLLGRGSTASRPKLRCDCADLRAVAYRSDGKLLAVAGRNGDLHLFDCRTNQLISEFKTHTGRIHQLVFLGDSHQLLSVGEDGALVVFDTDEKRVARRVPVTGGKLFTVVALDAEHVAVAGSENMIQIINLTLGRAVEQVSGHTGSIAALASDGNILYSGGYDATLRRWELSGVSQRQDRIAERDTRQPDSSDRRSQ